MKRYITLIPVLFLLLCEGAFGQVPKDVTGSILFHGLVMDAVSEVPLSGSQIFINRLYFSSSDNEGKFAFYVNRRDTVVFSRLGYKKAIMYISDTLTGKEFIAGIFLQSDTLLIGEVVIVPRIASLKSDLFAPRSESSTELENARYNLAVSAYQGRVGQSRLGDPAMNYELLRRKQASDASYKGQLSPDQMVSLSPLLLIPAAYMLIKGFPEKPGPIQPVLTDQEVNMIHNKYFETLRKKK